MNNPLLKKLLPHVIAIAVFLVVSMLFCKPVLEGNVMNQHDNVGWKGMAQEAFEYKEKNGHMPLWNSRLFSGMPNYQVAMEGKTILPDTVKLFSLGLPKPINFFFLACIWFYVLTLVLRVHPVAGILGSVAYAFSSYNAVIVTAGHDTQMLVTAYMPLLMAGLLSIYHKKYGLGFAITTYAAYMLIGINHLQVTYYFVLIAVLVTLGYVIKWIREKEWKHIAIAGGLTLIAAAIAIASSALILKTTSEYAAYTMRGGKDIEIKGDSLTETKTSGLDTSYAFEYSIGKPETFTLLMPGAFGGGSYARLSEGSEVAKRLMDKGVPENNAEQVAQSLPKYWGKIFTAGPAYLGVLIFILGLLGFVIVKSELRWGLLAATILGIFMTWGKYFAGFNVFLFENLPLYNKFRAPSFAQVIPQFTMGIMAVLTLHQLLFTEKSQAFVKENLRKILITTGILIGFLGLLYFMLDYSAPVDPEILAGYKDPNGSDEMARLIIGGLKAERQSLFGKEILRTLGILLLGAAALWLQFKKIISPLVAGLLILAVTTVDVTLTGYKYINNENDEFSRRKDNEKLFVSKDDYMNTNFSKSPFDEQILKDTTPHYRVFNMIGTSNGSPFSESRTSYFHRSVGGYHPAKLRIYQDLIEYYLMGNTPRGVLNMLDAKYIVTMTGEKEAPPQLLTNTEAYGACWLVSHVQPVDGNVAMLKSLDKINLRDTAVLLKTDAGTGFTQPQRDSASYIRLVNPDNDHMEYEALCNGPQFAVFSEIYYPKGWNAYIDGKPAEYVRTNYVLRGMQLPAGKHKVEFRFEPESVKQGNTIMYISSFLVLLSVLGGFFAAWRAGRKKNESPVSS